MKCKICDFRWDIGNQTPVPDHCPLCKGDFARSPEQIYFDNLTELMVYVSSFYKDLVKEYPETFLNIIDDLGHGMGEDLFYFRKTRGSMQLLKLGLTAQPKQLLHLRARFLHIPFGLMREFAGLMDVFHGKKKLLGTDLKSKACYLAYGKNAETNYKRMALLKCCEFATDEDLIGEILGFPGWEEEVDFLKLIKDWARMGHGPSILALAKCQKEADLAFSILLSGQETGNPEILYQIGLCHLYGRGTLEDPGKAYEVLKKAKEAGKDCGMLLHDLSLVLGDKKLADEVLTEETAKDNPDATYYYALHLIHEGEGWEQDFGRSLMTKLSEEGHLAAQKKEKYLKMREKKS